MIRMLVEKDLPLDLHALVHSTFSIFGERVFARAVSEKSVQEIEAVNRSRGGVQFGVATVRIGTSMNTAAADQLTDFIYDRLAGSLREQGYSVQEVDAVLALRPQRLALVEKQLAAVRAFAALPESPALATANKRIANILKKAEAEGPVDPHVNPELLQEQAEQDLYAALQRFVPEANAQFDAGDYTASLQTLAVLRAPVDAFFDDVMVNAEQLDLRLNRQGLLKSLHEAMNRVADLARLAA